MGFRMSTKTMKLKLFAKSFECALQSNFSEVKVQSFHQLFKGFSDPKMLVTGTFRAGTFSVSFMLKTSL